MKRRIIQIDTDKCNGCGACAAACHEGAIAMVDGKATLMRDDYCDGLGDCLPACPTGAITFTIREAAAYDEAAVMANKQKKMQKTGMRLPGGCPGSLAKRSNTKHAMPPNQLYLMNVQAACPSGRYRLSWLPSMRLILTEQSC